MVSLADVKIVARRYLVAWISRTGDTCKLFCKEQDAVQFAQMLYRLGFVVTRIIDTR